MNWNDVINHTKNTAAPDRRVEMTDEEWKAQLTPEQYRVTRQHGTERAFTGEYCEAHAPGIYACVCCGTELFNSTTKFESGTGWPSFTEPVKDNVIRYKMDNTYGMQRVEVLCNVCDAHLGHVFPDGPPPSGLRFCINSASLKKTEGTGDATDRSSTAALETATVGGGCFWCIEAYLDQLRGVHSVTSGYAGGHTENPTYYAVCEGDTGHAEVVQVEFDPKVIAYSDLLKVFLIMHNPTTKNRQGADVGTQYRSIILTHSAEQAQTAKAVVEELQAYYEKPIVTEIVPLEKFYPAELHHQDYYKNDPSKAYCQSVISPKLAKMREYFKGFLKTV
ncbi:bifunctional methionine sulfoxide reductase B/A protein [Flaviaesturariibacter flavus]|uniref:Multifunctional fusion protein n=1 Tax=Flaviaesturariibacter flavus TaxID=2502780 RepID=A0A4R1BAK1_9BACT|nr:bifunctional methionine sulfoxide reductase B/A protein [Flaviaesturariibacter flavus]TCJ13970.1 bifunctional methionine sulfoxide reductase B/A protein [Flaviaesturariibacter flavus]